MGENIFGRDVRLEPHKVHNYHEYLTPYDLSKLHITSPLVLRNLVPSVLYEEAIRYETGSIITDAGALAVTSHKYTGRLPKEKRFVKDETTENILDWGEINIPINEHSFNVNRARALDYLNSRRRIYIVDSFAGWDPRYRVKIRSICSRAYHALFMTNMLIVPNLEELAEYGEPDFTIINGGVFPANRHTAGITSDASIILNMKKREIVILGTEYAGEMKKAVFSVMNYLMALKGILPMHCSANIDENSNCSLFFGLSGTGKTTLSSDPALQLVGDDEHCWTDTGIFNIEGGCYAKCIDPPEAIKKCITFGALLENITYDDVTRKVDYSDESVTTNTRASYPLSSVENNRIPAVAPTPENIIFLSCDAFGVLPPVSRLDKKQAMFHFINGYTSKTPSTEVGITMPEATFSACFGGVFLPLDPVIYTKLFKQKLENSNAKVWLVNTGWIGGSYGSGKRMVLRHTQAIIKGICDGSINNGTFKRDAVFGLEFCSNFAGLPDTSLDARKAWENKEAYDVQSKKLYAMFLENIKKYDTSSFL